MTQIEKRSSGREIAIEIGEEVFTARLLDKKAPKTCETILSILPYEGCYVPSVLVGKRPAGAR